MLTSQAVNETTSFRSQEVVEETCVCSFLFPHVQLEPFSATMNGKHEINPKRYSTRTALGNLDHSFFTSISDGAFPSNATKLNECVFYKEESLACQMEGFPHLSDLFHMSV